MRPAGRFEKIWNTGSYFRLNNFKNRIYQSCGGGKTETQASPHLSCTLKPVLSCKLVRLVLCVPAQLNQEMVRGDTLCGLRREQQRVQQHHPSRCRPMSGRPPHRVRLASVRPSACSSGLRGVRVERLVYGMLLAREEGEEEKEDRRMWRGVESKHLLAVRWWDHWKLDFDEVEPLTLGGSSWGTLCGAKAASSAFSLSPPPPPLLSSVIHLPYSLGYSVLVTLYQWAPAGVTLRFLPGWARRHFSAPWRISLELNLIPWCWNKQIHPPKYRCDDLLKVLPPRRCRMF